MTVNQKKTRSLANIAGIVAIATLLSKVVGYLRERAIVYAFGLFGVADAYSYAYLIPSFFVVLLGGINGPFHSALVSVISKKNKDEAAPIVETITTLVSCALLLVTIALVIFAEPIINLTAPDLTAASKVLAVQQLQIMAPSALLAGLIGIGFGVLNASDQYWLPSISPLFSSLALIVGLGFAYLQLGAKISTPEYAYLGGIILAGGTLAGSVIQWLIQVVTQWRSGLGTLRLRFDWRIPGVSDVLKILIPASISSGMLLINTQTAYFFASRIAGAGAAMRAANFVFLTPLGIISNIILVPYFPIFSKLAAPENWDELKERMRQSLLLCALTMLPFSAIFICLSTPVTKLLYEGGKFQADATQLVASLLIAYGFGMFFYLARDVLVRVFYALGDGETPFRISIINIIINAFLDYLLINVLGAPGLIFATVIVNFFSMSIFLWILNRRLKGLPLKEWGSAFFSLLGASFLAGLIGYATSLSWQNFLGNSNLFLLLGQLVLSTAVILMTFTAIAVRLKLPEVDILALRLGQKLKRKSS
ncbi:MAG: murein biosynthesis integral membrane protein MurJ [Xenococcaceae cyanobacterium]